MQIFIAFVVIVVLIGLGFGRAMAKVTLAIVGIIALIAGLIILANILDRPARSAQVSYQTPAPAQAAPVQPTRKWWYGDARNSWWGPFQTQEAALADCTV
jgi:hypothetical protein